MAKTLTLWEIAQQTLKERKTVGTVYHFTGLDSLFKLLHDNKLKSSRNASSTSRWKDVEYVSTTRDKNFVYSRSKSLRTPAISAWDVALVLDGTKMSSKYRAVPHDDRATNKGKSFAKLSGMGDEMETTWIGKRLTKDEGITPIIPYIEKILLTKAGIMRFISSSEYSPFPEQPIPGISTTQSIFIRYFEGVERQGTHPSSLKARVHLLQRDIQNAYGIQVELTSDALALLK